MRIQINRPFLATVLVLVLAVSSLILASPIAKALDVDTAATIVAAPDPLVSGKA